MRPKLRFKDFAGKWEVKRGSELFINSRTKGNDKLPLYSVTLDRGMVPRDSLDRRVESETEGGDNLFVAKNDISYNMMRMWQGAFGLAPVDCMVSPAYVVLHPRENAFSDFFARCFSRSRNLYLFTAFSYGLTSDRLRLYFKDFERIKFTVPTLPEQQKIASFLSAVDEKIQQLTRKKELLEQYKKGVMQQLFSCKLRFKDENGKAYPKWEEKKLGEIGNFQTSSVDKLSVEGEKEVYLVNYMNVYRHELLNKKTIHNLQIVTAKENQIDSSNLKKGDILFTPSSETPSDIGHSVVIFEDLPNCVYSYHLMRFRPYAKLDILYSHYFCNVPDVLRQLTKLSTGSTRFTISVKSFSSVEVDLPSFEEQQKIANFLSAIDTKIESVATQIEKTQTFKKGLLQQMFV